MNPFSLTILAISLLSFLMSGAAHGQEPAFNDPQYSAPVKWTEYRIASQKLSIQFPKLPVLLATSESCSQVEGKIYYAYAAGVVYEFAWYANSRGSIPKRCETKTKFSETVFTNQIERYKKEGFVETDETIAGTPAKVLRSSSTVSSVVKTRWLLWLGDRWLEFGITTRKGTSVDPKVFPGGLKLSRPSGIDIGKGALATLGDDDVDLKSVTHEQDVEAMVVIAKPRPGYSTLAREQNTQGNVIVRVTFLRNGGMGAVKVVKALPDGLTEQAIAAAKKISFLPKLVNGEPVSVTRQLEYTFRIY